MKTQIKKIAVTICLALVSGLTFAQAPTASNTTPPPTTVAPSPGDLPPAPMPGKHKRGPERDRTLKVLTTLTGKITSYVANERYIYNSFTMQNGSQSVTVKFPEQLGQQLMAAAKKGESISVKGFNDIGPDGVSTFQLVSATAGSTQIVDAPPAAPVQPVVAQNKTYSGNISDFKRDQRGTINGLNLDNKILVDLPPHATMQLQSLLKTGDKIELSGFKDTPPAGVALAANAPTIVHPQTITISGQTYLLR